MRSLFGLVMMDFSGNFKVSSSWIRLPKIGHQWVSIMSMMQQQCGLAVWLVGFIVIVVIIATVRMIGYERNDRNAFGR